MTISNYLIRRAQRTPYEHIDSYMERYWLFGGGVRDYRKIYKPTLLERLFGQWIGIRVHKILRSDADRHLHDHPWASLSILLKRGYYEVLPRDQAQHASLDEQNYVVRFRAPGEFVFRRAADRHKLKIYSPCWSLFIMFGKQRSWGFHTAEGWVHWREYLGVDGRSSAVPVDSTTG